MNAVARNNVHVSGAGPSTLMFSHGFGCDQNMWRLLMPGFDERFQVITYDLVGNGASDLLAYDFDKYGSLKGYADDVLDIVEQCATGPVIFVGHSVSAMIGLLANVAAPRRFAAQIMISPSPCYINHPGYVGGFERSDIDSMLETLDSNYLGWSGNMAPAIMGAPDQPDLGVELTNSFCRTDPEIARHFARVTFMSDNREQLPLLEVPTLILQCTDDIIAPVAVGDYMVRAMPHATLALIRNTGHCPHLSAPVASRGAIDRFIATLDQRP